jgi:putative hydrolase of the HAD superfamily
VVRKFDIIAFDADDTLWHNEIFYAQGKEHFKRLLAPYVDPALSGRTLDEVESANVAYYGYGIKSFALSMVECALTLTNGQVNGEVIAEILSYVKRLLVSDPQHLTHVRETLEALAPTYDLMLITKGDLFEQERKIAHSGLSEYFRYIEVVSNKTPEIYQRLLAKYALDPKRFLMIGNSLRSDILPVVEIGGQAIYIHYDHTWEHEKVLHRRLERHEYFELEGIDQVPAFIERLEQGWTGEHS